MHWTSALPALLLLWASSAAAETDSVSYPAAATSGLFEAKIIPARIHKPAGNGPFPAVVVLHGCDGAGLHQETWAERLVSWGYVAMVPDSFTPRTASNVCLNMLIVPPAVRAADAIGAAEFLKRQVYVQAMNIGAIGFAHGGGAIMRLVQEGSSAAGHAIKGAVAYYPPCDVAVDTDVALPTLIVIGGRDTGTPAYRCRDVAAALKRPELVDLVVYPGAHHAFDVDHRSRLVLGMGVDGLVSMRRYQHDPEADEDAQRRTRAFFEKLLR